jgi:hypothetical protein
MLRNPGVPIVFGGASLELVALEHLRRLEVRPPVRRGDLAALMRDRRPGRALVLDGLFGWELAVTPTECRELLEAGWQLVGASSMGALRAAELWSAGMVGIGDVFTQYRLGALRSDADVAVIFGPCGEELTATLVHVRAVLAEIERRGLASGAFARRLVATARRIHWTQRVWPTLIDGWRAEGLTCAAARTAEVLAAEPLLHPKKRDGLLAVRSMLGARWVEPLPLPVEAVLASRI